MRKYIPQMRPWFGDEEKDALVAYLESDGWMTEFLKTREFEAMIAAYVNASHVSVVANGTLSLSLALQALEVQHGDEVLVPDLTMVASANAVHAVGARPIFVDVDAANLCMDLHHAEALITDRTKAIMLVSLNGRSPDMAAFQELCACQGLALVEDAAQSLGSFHKGRHLGTFGVIGSFSFSAPKIITTGQGGCVVTDDEALAGKMRMIKDFGRTRSGVDHHEVMGYNYKFTDLQAVVGIEQMKRLSARVSRKKSIYRRYAENLEGVDGVQMVPTDLDEVAPWFIDVYVPDRDGLASHLAGQGIGTRVVYPPVHSQPAWSQPGSYPVSEDYSRRGLWLPSDSSLSDAEVDRVCGAIRAFFHV